MGATKYLVESPTETTMMDRDNNSISKLDRSRPRINTPASPVEYQDRVEKCATGRDDMQKGPNHKDSNGNKIRVTKEEVTIGTWNVRTLNALGKVEQLDHEMRRYRWSVIGLAEVRWTGIGVSTTGDGHKLWYSGDEKYHARGVGFLVHKDVAKSVMECRPISSRVIILRLAAQPFNISIVQVYAPTSEASDEDMDAFYQELNSQMKEIPKKDIVLVIGDWNAKVGTDAYPTWEGTAGRFGLGLTNERGLGLLEFAKYHDLVLANTLHPQKSSRKSTWHSPDGKTHNLIDYIMINRRYLTSLSLAQTRSFTGADIGSDHELVMTNMRLKLKKIRKGKSPRMKFDLEKLKDPDIAAEFEAKIGGRFAPLLVADIDAESLNNQLNQQLTDTAEEVLGRARGKKNQWMTDEVFQLCDKRREQKKKRFQNSDEGEAYRKSNKAVKKAVKEAKEKWINDKCDFINTNMECNNTAAAYQTVRELTKKKGARTTVIEDKNGSLLTEQKAVLNRWSEYCEELYNYQLTADQDLLDKLRSATNTDGEGDPPILLSEVEEAINSLREGKSPGIDSVQCTSRAAQTWRANYN